MHHHCCRSFSSSSLLLLLLLSVMIIIICNRIRHYCTVLSKRSVQYSKVSTVKLIPFLQREAINSSFWSERTETPFPLLYFSEVKKPKPPLFSPTLLAFFSARHYFFLLFCARYDRSIYLSICRCVLFCFAVLYEVDCVVYGLLHGLSSDDVIFSSFILNFCLFVFGVRG